MSGATSMHESYRCLLAGKLRSLGARTVVGIYAKVDKTPCFKSVEDWNRVNGQVQELLANPPGVEIFDRLAIWTHDGRRSVIREEWLETANVDKSLNGTSAS